MESRDNQVFVTRGPGFAFPLHLHPHLELFFVHAGSVQATVARHVRTLQQGDAALIFPSQIHSYYEPSADNRNTIVVLDLSYVGPYLDRLLRCSPVLPFLKPGEVHENILYALEEMHLEFQGEQRREIYAPLIQLILARVFQAVTLQENRNAGYQEQTLKIAEYVNCHFQEAISLDSMGKHLGICKFRLSRLFSTMFGQSFSSYVNNIRLYHACSLLVGSDLRITDVSEEAGFGSLRTFFRVFKQEYGMSPMTFRNQQKPERRHTMQ